MYLDVSNLESYVEAGLLRKSELDGLNLYCYTKECEYKKAWDEVTRTCRGVIVERDSGKVIANVLPKFYNYNEMPETTLENLPRNLKYDVYEKMDGVLCNFFRHNNEWRIATKGSFHSEFAIFANELLKNYKTEFLPEGWTPIAELISPMSKIIVNYGERTDLVLLALRNVETGEYASKEQLFEIADLCGFGKPNVYSKTIEELVNESKTIPWNMEGWVVVFENGLRVKIKGVEYFKIVKIKTHTTVLGIWEAWKDGLIESRFQNEIPEEIIKDANKIYNNFLQQAALVKATVVRKAAELNLSINTIPLTKEQSKQNAEVIFKSGFKQSSLLFEYLKNRDITSNVIKLLRPEDGQFVNIEELVG